MWAFPADARWDSVLSAVMPSAQSARGAAAVHLRARRRPAGYPGRDRASQRIRVLPDSAYLDDVPVAAPAWAQPGPEGCVMAIRARPASGVRPAPQVRQWEAERARGRPDRDRSQPQRPLQLASPLEI